MGTRESTKDPLEVAKEVRKESLNLLGQELKRANGVLLPLQGSIIDARLSHGLAYLHQQYVLDKNSQDARGEPTAESALKAASDTLTLQKIWNVVLESPFRKSNSLVVRNSLLRIRSNSRIE
eukprot:scaffold18819_cov268-Amphora_coffeaeformis.AAC.7